MTIETKKQPLLISGRELKNMSMTMQPQDWIVEGLLRTGRRRMSLLAGKPESGKSTLALQLAVSVCKGEPFLGRSTVRSEVLYWNTEEDVSDVWDSLQHLGYDPDRDMALWLPTGSTDVNPVQSLRNALAEHPDVRLVILETVDDVLRIDDIKENTAARQAFTTFDAAIMEKFSQQVTFLGLHHLKKRETDSTGDMLLGATWLRGRTDAKLYLKQISDSDDRRVFHATVRKGRSVAPTILNFDKHTGKSTLGITVVEERKRGAVERHERILQSILEYFHKNPGKAFETDCLPCLECNSDEARRIHKRAVVDGLLSKSGKGTRGNPFVYRVAGIPDEERKVA